MANHQRKINCSMRFRLPKLKQKTSRVSSSSDNRRTSQPETSPKRSEAHHHHHHRLQASHCAIEHSKPVSHRHHSTPLRSSRASPSETTSSSSSSKHQTSSLDILSADVQLQVFSFLDLTALRKMMATNRAFRALLASDSAYKVWHAICLAKFAMHEYDSEHGIFLHDDFGLPIAAVSPNPFSRYNRVNLPLLLSMTPHHVPTGMADEHVSDNDTIDAYSYLPSLIQVFSDDEEESTNDDGERGPHLDNSFESTSSLSSAFDVRLHYNGNVGSGQVYSVKANHPLPKPTLQVSPNKKNKNKKNKMRILKSKCKSSSQWNPMVIPYNSIHDAPRLIHVTPRLVSYFEISITAAAPEPETRRPVRFDNADGPRIQDCVVIGLATQAFCPRGTLPGWDLTSFGYHSDNGGLYHGSGHARQRTESFGPGDTVGMGVDYVTKTIFVTKNGRFLGSAYDVFTTEFLATMDLYPVVGMDSKDAVHVNYGGIDHPFHFNLASYCHRQQQNSKSRIATKFQFTQDSNGVQVGC